MTTEMTPGRAAYEAGGMGPNDAPWETLTPGDRRVWEEAAAAAVEVASADLRAERDEAQSEAAMIRGHADRYLRARYGPDYVYRAPETFGNMLERWIWAVGAGVPELAHSSIGAIEEFFAGRAGADGDRP